MKMARSRLLALAGTTLSAAVLTAAPLVPAAGAESVTVEDCHTVVLNRAGHVELSLSTKTTGAISAEADVAALAALRVCYSLTAAAGVNPAPSAPVVTVTPMPPDPNDTTACAQVDLAIQALGAVTGHVTATVAAEAALSASGLPPVSASESTTVSQDININPPEVGEHVKAKACISTTGDVDADV